MATIYYTFFTDCTKDVHQAARDGAMSIVNRATKQHGIIQQASVVSCEGFVDGKVMKCVAKLQIKSIIPKIDDVCVARVTIVDTSGIVLKVDNMPIYIGIQGGIAHYKTYCVDGVEVAIGHVLQTKILQVYFQVDKYLCKGQIF